MSPRTVAAYRDAFMLFLDYIQAHHAKSPANVKLADLTPELILGFLDHLEHKRHNSVRSRNARLAALRAFLKCASHRDVSSLHVIERSLGIPVKRFERPMLGFLSREEMVAVIGIADNSCSGSVTIYCWGCCTTLAREYPRLLACRSPTSCSTAPLAFTCAAKVAKPVQGRCGAQPSRRSGRGSSRTPISDRPRRCCRTGTARR